MRERSRGCEKMTLVFSADKEIKIKSLINTKKYPVDLDYQREPEAWTREDEQYFIDSILKKIKIPKIYLHKKRSKFYIIDGQQRIETIRYFITGRKENGVKSFLKIPTSVTLKKKDIFFNNLSKSKKEKFLNNSITASIIKKGRDEEIRDLFRRLQRGRPLTEGEKLNAMPGNVVKAMRSLTEQTFFKKCLTSRDKRHKFYHIAAVFLYLEDKLDDTNFGNVVRFFKKNQDIRESDKIYRKCWNNLNFLAKCYRDDQIPSSRLGWLTSVYLFAADIRNYGLVRTCSYTDIHDYLESFYTVIYSNEEKRKGDYRKFYDMIHAATNSKSNIKGRHEILKKYFIDGFGVHLKDERRLFNSVKDRKIVYNRANGKCQYKNCDSRMIKFNEKFDVHHKKLHAAGGKKDYRNALLVHPECHRAIHKNMKLKRIQK